MMAMKSTPLHVLVCVFALYAIPAAAQPAELFISEYIEGSSNNKAIEIYNGTGAAINLGTAGYNIQMFFNGNPVSTLTINLTGPLADGDVYVIAQASANAAILAQTDQTNGSGWFNGNDAVVLRKGTTIIDAIGQAGFDPGSQWGSGLTSTADNTMRRKTGICAGDTNATDVFNPALEWDGFANDTFGGLGAHSTTCTANAPVIATCGAPLSVFQGSTGSSPVAASDADGSVVSIIINNVTPAPAGGTITLGNLLPASAIGGSATALITASAGLHPGSYAVQITATNDDATPQTGTCAKTVHVVAPMEIWQIQGNGPATPFAGQQIRTENNIVTALGRSNAGVANGFFIQTPDARADASDQTSNGLFVFTGSSPSVDVGDLVDVTGIVVEFNGWTEVTNPGVAVHSHGHALPAAVLFNQIAPGVFVPSHEQPWPPNELERFENMLVRVENGRVSAPANNFGEASIVADSTRPFREPGIVFPGDPGHPVVWDGNPEIFVLKAGGAAPFTVSLKGGTVIDVAEGPLAFSFGNYQLWPTTLELTEPELPRPVRARNPGEFTVASQNLLRLFDSDRTNGPDDGTANAAQYPTKLLKASRQIRTVLGAPDVVVIEEVENLGVAEALAAQIAADDPLLVYTAYLIEGHDVGGIDTGMLVRNTVVGTVSQLGATSLFTGDDPPSFLHDRPPLVLQGEYIANGAPFPVTVIGIHNRSLTNIETSSRNRQKRLAQALEIARYMQSIQTSEPGRRVVLTGDFNAFEFSDGYVDAIGIITGNLDPDGAIQPGHEDVVEPNLIDQVSTLPQAERYSFIFGGSAQVLDHTLTTANLATYLRGLQFSRGNTDAPASFRSDPSTALGTSDHDAEVLFVMTDHDADGSPDDADNCSTNPNPGQQNFDGDAFGDSCDDDDDNDGVLDGVDGCQLSSPLGMFVVVDACATDVPDQLLITGCSITESIAAIGNASRNHGKFVSGVTHLATEIRKDGIIDNKQRSHIVRCAAWANVP